jgi:Cu/Ag efflux pump CusA
MAIKVFGEDLGILAQKAEEIKMQLQKLKVH